MKPVGRTNGFGFSLTIPTMRSAWFSEKLDNEPIVNRDMRLGMALAVSYDNIRDHRTASSFKQ